MPNIVCWYATEKIASFSAFMIFCSSSYIDCFYKCSVCFSFDLFNMKMFDELTLVLYVIWTALQVKIEKKRHKIKIKRIRRKILSLVGFHLLMFDVYLFMCVRKYLFRGNIQTFLFCLLRQLIYLINIIFV